MSLLDRRMTSRRRRPTPAFDRLEGRQLLSTVPTSAAAASATTKAHHAAALHHVSAASTATTTANHATTTTAHHASAAHTVKAAAFNPKKLNDATHHVVNLSATSHQQGKAATAAQAKATKLTDFVIRYPYKKPATNAKKLANFSPIGGLTPAQVTNAYGVNLLPASNQGQGTTIAIIDEFHDPNILSDSNIFSDQYNLPKFNSVAGGPTLTVVEDTTFGNVPTAPVGSTAGETSLDVQWAHAIAPKANIILVEVPASGGTNNQFAELLEGIQFAAKQPGVDAISLSYGYPEVYLKGTPSIITLNSTYLANGPAAKLPVTVSTGDYALPLFPAMTDNVIGVGGTSLYLNGPGNLNYNYETSWGGPQDFGGGFLISKGSDGGGLSNTFGSPSFQSSNGVTYPNRSIPDLSAIADPYTGVAFYDSLDAQGGNPWSVVGGTSLASPVVAAMIDLAQQDRIAANKPLLNSVQINSADYAAYNSAQYATLFHDITQGTNEDYQSGYPFYSSTTGYDLTTGVGTPRTNTFVPYLASV